MNAYTPGPWEVGNLDRNGQRVVRGEIEVCTCWHHCVGSLEEQMEANARLIAAAPDDTVSLACAFAWDVGAGNRLEMTPEEFDECIEIRFAPEIEQLKKDVKPNPILVTP